MFVNIIIDKILVCSPLLTRRTPNPTKFFDEQLSPIVDYEFGDLRELSVRALQNDVSFVMYCKLNQIFNL